MRAWTVCSCQVKGRLPCVVVPLPFAKAKYMTVGQGRGGGGAGLQLLPVWRGDSVFPVQLPLQDRIAGTHHNAVPTVPQAREG